MTTFRCRLFILVFLVLTLTGLSISVPGPGWAQGQQMFFLIRQGEFTAPLTPISEDRSAVLFYNFNNDQSNTGFEVPEHSLIILHRDRTTGMISLVLIMSSPNNPSGGSASFSLDGLPLSATLDLQDDPADTFDFNPPTAEMSWQWLPEHSDGAVIGNLGEEFEITIRPNFISGIIQWEAINGEGGGSVPLPNLVDPVTIIGTRNAPPEPHFSVSPERININVSVAFDACASRDPDGVIVKYEWDFDGDGVFEVSTSEWVVQHTFTGGGRVTVTVRVTDDKGGVATVSQTFVIAEEIVSAVRTISTPQTLPGLTFRVRIDLQVRADVNGLGIDEDLPPGWDVTPIDNAGATFKRAETQWIFPSVLRAGESRRIVYDVTVIRDLISGPLPARQTIQGVVDSAAPAFRAPVTGEGQVEVTSCLSIPVAVAHLDPDTDTVDLRVSEEINFDQLQRAVTYWIEEVGVPSTCDALVDLEVLKVLIARELTDTPVDQPLPPFEFNNVNPQATRTILTPLPFHQLYLKAEGGEVFRVRLEFRADQDVNGLGLSESLPRNWEVRPLDNGGAAFKASTREWAFTERIRAGETRAVIYEVIVPLDEASGLYTLSGNADSALPRFQVALTDDNTVEVVECLSIPIAIAHLDTDAWIIDVSLSNRINFEQVQAAIAFWLEDEEVPGTCGQTIGFQDIKALIAFWLTDTPVDQPLPGGLPEPPTS